MRWTILFIVIAFIAAMLGFGGLAETGSELAKIIFYICIALFVFSLARHISNEIQ